MRFKYGDIVIVSKVTVGMEPDEDDDDDLDFLIRRRGRKEIFKVVEIKPEQSISIRTKVLSSLVENQVGRYYEFRESEILTLNEAVKRGQMYED